MLPKDAATLYLCVIRTEAKIRQAYAKAYQGADRATARNAARLRGLSTTEIELAEKQLRQSKYLKLGASRSDLVPTALGLQVACPAGLGRAKKAKR